MPSGLKRLVRERQRLTGESYQAALRHVRAGARLPSAIVFALPGPSIQREEREEAVLAPAQPHGGGLRIPGKPSA